jgi:hypothetical protein
MISLALLQEKFAELRTTYGFGTLFFSRSGPAVVGLHREDDLPCGFKFKLI